MRDAQTIIAQSMSEKDLLEHVRNTAKMFGWLLYHTHRSDRSEPGFPDLVLVKGERIIYAELKAEKGKLTVDQEAWLAALRAVRDRTEGWYKPDGPQYETFQVEVWRPRDWLSGYIERSLRR